MENLGEEHLQKRQDFIKFSDNMENKYTNNENQKNQELDIPSSVKLSNTLHKEPKYVILSDEIGRGIISKLTKQIDLPHNLTNYCKPGATMERILENIDDTLKTMTKGDTIMILISRYDPKYIYRNYYIKRLQTIIQNNPTQCNILITGMRYDGWNDHKIFNLNDKIALLSSLNENVRYVDLNSSESGFSSYVYAKKQITQQVVSIIQNKFHGSTSLVFVDQKHANFQGHQESVILR